MQMYLIPGLILRRRASATFHSFADLDIAARMTTKYLSNIDPVIRKIISYNKLE